MNGFGALRWPMTEGRRAKNRKAIDKDSDSAGAENIGG
jgi:hypothetical protein